MEDLRNQGCGRVPGYYLSGRLCRKSPRWRCGRPNQIPRGREPGGRLAIQFHQDLVLGKVPCHVRDLPECVSEWPAIEAGICSSFPAVTSTAAPGLGNQSSRLTSRFATE